MVVVVVGGGGATPLSLLSPPSRWWKRVHVEIEPPTRRYAISFPDKKMLKKVWMENQ